MTFKQYPEYKDVTESWLGRVPINWSVFGAKRVFFERNIKAQDVDDQLTASQKYGVIPQKLFTELEGVKVMQVLTGREILKKAEPGDFVISMRSFQGGLEYCEYSGAVSSAYVPLYPAIKIENSFFKHLFKSNVFISALQLTSNLVRDGQALRYANFSLLSLPLPPIDEQTQIARFLNHEIGKIDALIAEQEKLIALLKEKRQAVISHTVTKGLYPDVQMKDSGVEWLGQVPEHWVVSALKYKTLLNPSKSSFSGDKDQECSFVPMEKLKTDVLILDEVRSIDEVFAGYTYFEDGDILMAKVTPCFENKNIAIASNLENGIGFGSSEIYVLRPIFCSSRFLFYRLQEDAFMAICTASMTGAGGLKRVPSELLNNFTFAFPDISEQNEIAAYLDSVCDKYSILQAEAEAAIELFKERRSALISATVTGKIDVRGWQPPETQ